jgi:hypothetical protein
VNLITFLEADRVVPTIALSNALFRPVAAFGCRKQIRSRAEMFGAQKEYGYDAKNAGIK